MRITEELRKYAEELETAASRKSEHGFSPVAMKLLAIADRIDEECERRQEDVIDDVLGGSLKMTDENMAENGWVRLPAKGEAPSEQLAEWIEGRGLVTGPLDADGELWHSGDMSDTNWGVIEGIGFSEGEWWIRGHDISAPWIKANSARHYHAPTVEDVLRDFAYCFEDGVTDKSLDEIVAEYAPKLQLRES